MAKYQPSARRDQLRQEMRASMLRAAEDLIRESGTVSFSVGELAKRAGSSVASLYNLIGTKSTILYTLLNETMDAISMPPHFHAHNLSPIDFAIATSEHAASVFTSDPELMRPLHLYVLGVPEPSLRPEYMRRSLSFWLRGLKPVHESGLLPQGVTLHAFARDHELFLSGAVDQWAQNEMDDNEFRREVRRAAILRLLVTDNPQARHELLGRLLEAERHASESASDSDDGLVS